MNRENILFVVECAKLFLYMFYSALHCIEISNFVYCYCVSDYKQRPMQHILCARVCLCVWVAIFRSTLTHTVKQASSLAYVFWFFCLRFFHSYVYMSEWWNLNNRFGTASWCFNSMFWLKKKLKWKKEFRILSSQPLPMVILNQGQYNKAILVFQFNYPKYLPKNVWNCFNLKKDGQFLISTDLQ